MVGDFGWEHEGTKSGVGTVKFNLKYAYKQLLTILYCSRYFKISYPF